MKATIYVANLSNKQAAEIGQELGLSGTVHSALGFGEWGIEPTTVVTLGNVSPADTISLCDAIFKTCKEEEALYVAIGNREPREVYRSNLDKLLRPL